jgi:hypothetical protein
MTADWFALFPVSAVIDRRYIQNSRGLQTKPSCEKLAA